MLDFTPTVVQQEPEDLLLIPRFHEILVFCAGAIAKVSNSQLWRLTRLRLPHPPVFGADSSLRRVVWAISLGWGLLITGCGESLPPRKIATPPVPRPDLSETPTTTNVSVPSDTTEVADDPELPPRVAQPTSPQPVFRPDDPRQPRNAAALAELGIRKFESRHLILYTDLEPVLAEGLPRLADELYRALEAYFGPMPASRRGELFQMTGYLMRNERHFQDAGLIPGDLPTFEHGRHRQNEFWMRDIEFDYYRRHLLLHEATHCFMTYLPDSDAPVWYLEGMAELFGTHRQEADGTVRFRVMPDAPETFAGWGRITLIRKAFAEDRARTIPQVFDLQPREYLQPEAYAWSWALCAFLDGHPRYHDRFQELGRTVRGPRFSAAFDELFATDARDLAAEWQQFVLNLQYGYDLQHAPIQFVPGTAIAENSPRSGIAIDAARGWQGTGTLLEAGARYRITASGEFTLADVPRPWTSTANGISIRYFDGQPLGRLLACLQRESGELSPQVLPIGQTREFVAPRSGALYLRLNDTWSDLADNRGKVTVRIERLPATP